MSGFTNIGVQLMPIILVVAAIGFLVLGAQALAITSFVFGLLFWCGIYSNECKSVNHDN